MRFIIMVIDFNWLNFGSMLVIIGCIGSIVVGCFDVIGVDKVG